MSDFEAIVACVLPHDPVARIEASAKNCRNNVSELNTSSMVGGRIRKNLDFRFYDHK